MLDLRRLLVLRAVAHHGSLSEAARQLGYTQPAITHHIRRLEREAGTPLVAKAGRGIRLTEAGQVLVAHAEVVSARLAAAEEEVAAIAGLRAGRARLASFPSSSATLVPAALAQLRASHPLIEVSLVEAEPPTSLALLRHGDCDLALTFEYAGVVSDEGADFTKTPLLTDRLLAVLPASHPLAQASTLDLAQLSAETWIAGCERCRDHLLRATAEAGFTPQIAFATDDYIAVQRLVIVGLGVALLPELVLATVALPGLTAIPLASAPQRQILAITPAATRQPPAVAATLAALQAASAATLRGRQPTS
ncbi:MAG TPA: LysR family transcriptional regulator [Streptosporangiaceae bacterium]|nr:LysR family transcriptional regulator [Streptosporangiaceae bacterium]